MTVEHQNTLTIAVMGATGTGKTTFINTLTGSNLTTSAGLRSCTEVIQETMPFQLDNRKVVVIDTPGFDDTTRTDSDILKLIAEFLVTSYKNGQRLSGLLFMHRISDVRMNGISSKNFRMFRQLCGEATLRNVVIVTNMWGHVNPEIGAEREQELAAQDDFFKPALDKGAVMMRHHHSIESARDIIRRVLGNHPLPLQIQREIVEEKKDVSQTAAAEEVNRELKAQIERERLEKERVKAEMEAALRRQQEEAQRQMELEARRVQEEIARAEAERARVAAEMERHRLETERRMQEEQAARQREAERAQREFEAQMQELQRRQAEEERRQREERERLERELHQQRMRHQHRRRHHGGDCSIQ